MQRERRYFVLKWKDAHDALSATDLKHLERIGEKVIAHRQKAGKQFFDCVVVESDWPEYEPTWNAIEARVDGSVVAADQQLTAALVNDQLVISIGVNVMAHATEYGAQQYFSNEVKVTDKNVFAEEILREITREEEDGTTPLHRMLDKAACNAIEYGAEGLTVDGE